MKHTKKMMLVPVQEGGSLDQQSQLHVTDGNTALQAKSGNPKICVRAAAKAYKYCHETRINIGIRF